MNAWLRQHRYALMVTVRRLIKQPFSSLANLLVMALALALPLLGSAIPVSVQPVARQMSVTPEVTVFMRVDAPAARPPAWPSASSLKTTTMCAPCAWSAATTRWPACAPTPPGSRRWPCCRATRCRTRWWSRWPTVKTCRAARTGWQGMEAMGPGRPGAAGQRLGPAAGGHPALRPHRPGLPGRLRGGRGAGDGVQHRAHAGAVATRGNRRGAAGRRHRILRAPSFLYLGGLSGALASLLAIGVAALALSPLNNALLGLARSYGAEFALRLPGTPVLAGAVLAAAVLGALSARWSVTRSTFLSRRQTPF